MKEPLKLEGRFVIPQSGAPGLYFQPELACPPVPVKTSCELTPEMIYRPCKILGDLKESRIFEMKSVHTLEKDVDKIIDASESSQGSCEDYDNSLNGNSNSCHIAGNL